MSDTPKTCALCRHLSLSVGQSFVPSSGYVGCEKHSTPYDNYEGTDGKLLAMLRDTAEACPDFELMG